MVTSLSIRDHPRGLQATLANIAPFVHGALSEAGDDSEQNPTAHKSQDPAQVDGHLAQSDGRQEFTEHLNGRVSNAEHQLDQHCGRAPRPEITAENHHPIDDEPRPQHQNKKPDRQP